MNDRTPTIESLEFLVGSLDSAVRTIYSHVPITSLREEEIIQVMQYMARDFSTRLPLSTGGFIYVPIRKFNIEGEAVFHDIAYRLMKDQIGRQIEMPEEQKSMLLDGVMGWLWYNPGTSHDMLMDTTLKNYVRENDLHP